MKHTFAKRSIDVCLAAAALLILFPILVLGALCVWWSMGRPIFFLQTRPGLQGKPFRLIKFRTMTDERDTAGQLLADERRATRVGNFLRRTTIDEIPELFSVLRGDMSLVGPRPLLMRYLPRYTPEQARRHEVRPGMTGWAVVHGRNNLSWEEKFILDVWYVDNRSIWLDFKILAKTIWLVLSRKGVSKEGLFSSEEFWGTGRDT